MACAAHQSTGPQKILASNSYGWAMLLRVRKHTNYKTSLEHPHTNVFGHFGLLLNLESTFKYTLQPLWPAIFLEMRVYNHKEKLWWKQTTATSFLTINKQKLHISKTWYICSEEWVLLPSEWTIFSWMNVGAPVVQEVILLRVCGPEKDTLVKQMPD